jgi:hypothetical protein
MQSRTRPTPKMTAEKAEIGMIRLNMKPFVLAPEFEHLKDAPVVEMETSDMLFDRELILTKDHAYDLMKVLLQHPGEDYFATAYTNELTDPDAVEFIYEFPLLYAKRIHRIFLLDSVADLERLDLKKKECLRKQIAAGADLKFVEKRNHSPINENIAIVGNTALGVLRSDGSNLVVFDPEKIQAKAALFLDWSAHATRLDTGHLLGPDLSATA